MWGSEVSRKNTIGDRDVIRDDHAGEDAEIQHRYYLPNNSALIIAGDVDPAAAFRLARKASARCRRATIPS